MDDIRLLTFAEVIEITKISRAHLYVMIGEKSFPAPLKISTRAVRFREQDVRQWLSELPTATIAPDIGS